jgi:hypothetical protein
MRAKPSLIVFSGGMRDTVVERLVGGARDASALDTLERGLASGEFAEMILVTDSEDLAKRLPPAVEADLDVGPFDFERRLRDVVNRRRIERPFYVGGGSLPLLSTEELAELARRLATAEDALISNNFFSADFVGWTPGAAIDRTSVIPSDNRLPQLLHEAGLSTWTTDRTIATQFDIDAPADLAALKLYGHAGPHLQAYLDAAELDLQIYRRAMRCFLAPVMVVVAGRVGSATWQFLERETACRVRVFSEERGMQADGREHSGEVRTILGFYLERAGPNGLMDALSDLGAAVFLDTRVLFAHARAAPSRAERFLSDLGRWQDVDHPFVRDLTRAAGEASIPIILGGHSLVSGGIMALVQAAWDAQDRGELKP